MTFLTLRLAGGLLLTGLMVFGQQLPPGSENGAVGLYTSGGWSFGVPAVRAFVSMPGAGTAISPEKKTLPAYGGGFSVRAWRFLVPFVDLTAFDTGKATAQLGSVRSEAQADTFALHAGVRLTPSRGRIRPFGQFGGGALRQNLKGTYTFGGASVPDSETFSSGSIMYGAGLQFFAGRKWGSTIGFDGFRLSARPIGMGQNFGRVHFGLFYQTKAVAE